MKFNYQDWVQLSIGLRQKIAFTFGVKKVGPTHVVNNEIQSDGYLMKDLSERLSLSALELHFNLIGMSYDDLWNRMLLEAEGKSLPEIEKEIIPIVEPLDLVAVVERVIKSVSEEKTIEIKKTIGWPMKKDKLEREGYTVILIKDAKKNKTKSSNQGATISSTDSGKGIEQTKG